MKPVIYFIQIIIGVLLILVIIIQQKGSGLGAAFGSSIGFYRSKRGAEKLLFYATILLSVLFVISALVGLVF